jgi:hypothetical protein
VVKAVVLVGLIACSNSTTVAQDAPSERSGSATPRDAHVDAPLDAAWLETCSDWLGPNECPNPDPGGPLVQEIQCEGRGSDMAPSGYSSCSLLNASVNAGSFTSLWCCQR